MYEYYTFFVIHLTRVGPWTWRKVHVRKPASDQGLDSHIQLNTLILIRPGYSRCVSMTNFLRPQAYRFACAGNKINCLYRHVLRFSTWLQHDRLAGPGGANGQGIRQSGRKGAFAFGAGDCTIERACQGTFFLLGYLWRTFVCQRWGCRGTQEMR